MFAILAIFIYHGHKWAMILAMLVWTYDKIFILAVGVNGNHGDLLLSVIWWAIYMHAFWLAYRVESERKKMALARTSSQ